MVSSGTDVESGPGVTTVDEYSTDVFDTTAASDSLSIQNMLANSPFISRSVNELKQIEEDLDKHQKCTRQRRSNSVGQIEEETVHVCAKFYQTIAQSIEELKTRKLYAERIPVRSTKKTARIPLSPTNFRFHKKQDSIKRSSATCVPKLNSIAHCQDTCENCYLSQPSSLKSPIYKSKKILFSSLDSNSSTNRKNETSDDIPSHTIDEYSNSIFNDDEDATFKDILHTDRSEVSFEMFDEDHDYEDLFDQSNSNSGPGSPVTPSTLKSIDKKNVVTVQESVTYNPLFNSKRAQTLIESKRQTWRIPADTLEEKVENPLFQNLALHQKLVKEKVKWEVPAENIKAKRRFFKKQSLSDMLSSAKIHKLPPSPSPEIVRMPTPSAPIKPPALNQVRRVVSASHSLNSYIPPRDSVNHV